MAATAGAPLAAVFSPGCAIPRERCAPKKKRRHGRPPLRCSPAGAAGARPALPLPSRLRLARLRSTKGDLNMATIGTFTKTTAGFTGSIQTVGLKAKVAITPVEKRGDTAPDYRAFVGKVEIGAGWARTSRGGREFVSLKLDDPSFPAPIYANLIERDGQHELIWSR